MTDDLDKLLAGIPAHEREEQKEFENVPQGTYTASITDATIKTERNSVSIEYTITGPSQANRKLWGNYQLTEQSIPFLKQDLRLLGADVNTLKTFNGLTAALEAVDGLECEVYVKHNGKYVNVYLNKVLGGAVKNETPDFMKSPEGRGFDKSENLPF